MQVLSPSMGMQRSLPAVARYVEAAPGAWVLPVGITGTEALFPVGEAAVRLAQAEGLDAHAQSVALRLAANPEPA